ncbi:hypothetical protein ACRU43_16385 [Mycobacterium colombiense]
MSSVRVLDRAEADNSDQNGDEWIAVQSPRLPQVDDAVTLVTDAIARVRLNFLRGEREGVEFTDIPEYGSGDAELADDIDRAVAENWDD